MKNILRKLFLPILLGMAFMVMTACNNVGDENDNQIHLKNWSEFDNREESLYFVYYYTDWCPACQNISQDVIEFNSSKPMGIQLYYANASPENVEGTRPSIMDGMYVPTIFVIQDGNVIDSYTGVNLILDLFSSVYDGTYSP